MKSSDRNLLVERTVANEIEKIEAFNATLKKRGLDSRIIPVEDKDINVFRLYLLVKDMVSEKKPNHLKLRAFLIENQLTDIMSNNSSLLYPPYRNTLLHHVITSENYHLANSIIEAAHDFINPNAVDYEGKTLLMLVTKMKKPHFVNQLLTREFTEKINVNAQDDRGRTALHYACALGDIEMVNLLLKYGADPAIKDKTGNRPIDFTYFPDYEVRQIFESVGIDPNRDTMAPMNQFLQNDDEFSDYSKENLKAYLAIFTDTSSQPFNPDTIQHYREVLSLLSGQSLLESSLQGQPLVREYMQSAFPHLAVQDITYEKNLALALLKLNNDEFEQAIIYQCPFLQIEKLEILLKNIEATTTSEGQAVVLRLLNNEKLFNAFFPDELEIPDEMEALFYPSIYAFKSELEQCLYKYKEKNFTKSEQPSVMPDSPIHARVMHREENTVKDKESHQHNKQKNL